MVERDARGGNAPRAHRSARAAERTRLCRLSLVRTRLSPTGDRRGRRPRDPVALDPDRFGRRAGPHFRAHVNRVLQRFRRDQLLTLEHRRLTLCNGGRLEAIAGFTPNYLQLNSTPAEVIRY